MQCPQCQRENPSQGRYCGECGARLESLCSACGSANPPTNKFCGQCGAALVQALASSTFSSPGAYTPKHLAEKILTSKSALEGERKQVTVLFADMKGSMELLADRDPEEARKLLDPIIEHMMEAVHRYEGTVSNLMGDGIMALFGAPVAHEDHAVRACYAALRMQESVNRYAEGVRRTEGVPIQIRVGLNSGEVVVGAIGNDLKMDYTAIGQTVHLAARMEQMAIPGSILASGDTLRLAEGYVWVKPIGPVNVKGLSARIEIYEVTRVGSARSRLQAATARGLTRFVGRSNEIEQLEHARSRAHTGRGQVVALVGEPGVGKSRLFHEFTQSHRVQDWLVLESGSVSYGKATPYLPVIDLLERYFAIDARDDARKIREKITGKIFTLDQELRENIPALLALLSVPVDETNWKSLDPSQKRQKTLDAVRRLLVRESELQAVVLVFEDLHWIDTETQALLNRLVEDLSAARILLLVNYRPEYRHSWAVNTYYHELHLAPLTSESAEELLSALLGQDVDLHAVKRFLIERTEGNPFFLEESVHALVETKVLEGERGAYRVAKPFDTAQIPATVRAVLAARIDRLSLDEKRLLQAASVIGKDFPLRLLQATVDLADEPLSQSLSRLQESEFLYETGLFPDLEYTFKHALTHEVAYQSQLRTSRQNFHERIARVLEQRFKEMVETQPQVVAHHYTEAGLGAQAVPYWQLAGEKASEQAARADAVTYLRRGLELLNAAPPNSANPEQELSLYTVLGRTLKDLRGYGDPEVEQAYSRARELCREVGGMPRLFPTLLGLAIYFVVRAELKTAQELGEQLLEMAGNAQDPVLLVEARYALGVTCFWLGEFVLAHEHLEHGIAQYDPCRHHSHIMHFGQDEGVVCLCRDAVSLWYLGYPTQALTRGTEALALARRLFHPASIAYAVYWTAFLYHQCRDMPKARELTDVSVALSSDQGFAFWPPLAAILNGWILSQHGRVEEGIVEIRNGLGALEAAGTEIPRSHGLGLLAQTYGKFGRGIEGLQIVDQALAAVNKTEGRWSEAELHHIKGELFTFGDAFDSEQAEICFRQAIAVARRHHARSVELRAAMSMSRLWQRQSKKEQARELLAETYNWFTEGFDTTDLKAAKALLDELA